MQIEMFDKDKKVQRVMMDVTFARAKVVNLNNFHNTFLFIQFIKVLMT